MPDPIRISIIIPTLNREQELVKTFESLLGVEYPAAQMEILVVDQTTKHEQATEEYLSKLASKKTIRWFRPPEINFASLTKARNFGISVADNPDILVFIDDDVTVQPDFLQRHAGAYADLEVGAVAGKTSVPGTVYPKPPYKVGRFGWFGRFYDNFHDDTEQYVDNFVGCNFSIRASILKETGLFDEEFIGNAIREESDMAIRVREIGKKILYLPSAALIHRQAASGGCRQDERMRFYFAFFSNHMLFYMKHASVWRLPFFVLRMWRPILACWLYYGKGNVTAFLVPWQGIRAGCQAAARSKKLGAATAKAANLHHVL